MINYFLKILLFLGLISIYHSFDHLFIVINRLVNEIFLDNTSAHLTLPSFPKVYDLLLCSVQSNNRKSSSQSQNYIHLGLI